VVVSNRQALRVDSSDLLGIAVLGHRKLFFISCALGFFLKYSISIRSCAKPAVTDLPELHRLWLKLKNQRAELTLSIDAKAAVVT